jgi:hypothetical protein
MGVAFVASVPGSELRQGEILSGITRFDFSSESRAAQPVLIGFCVTLNQDCDLLQDFNDRKDGGQGILAHILLAEAQLGSSLKTKTERDIWRRISQNQDIRYQTFSTIPEEDDLDGGGIECLVVDFKSIFSMPSEELYRQLAGPADRRSSLADLYRENFQSRVTSYLSRVMLPEPHKYKSPPA